MEASDVRRLQPIDLPIITYRSRGRQPSEAAQDFRVPPGTSIPQLAAGLNSLMDAACRGLMEDAAALEAARVSELLSHQRTAA